MTRVAVLGSNSFSGASFCSYALGQGAEVLAVSRSPEPDRVFLPYRWNGAGKALRFHQLDLNRNLEEIDALFRQERPDYIVNFAAQSMVGQSWDVPEHWFQTNAVATTMLFKRLREYDFLSRYVHITTPEVYGSTSGTVAEETPFNPSTPYAVSRAAGDMSLKAYMQAYDLPAVMTRAANVFGPGQQLYRIVPRTFLYCHTGRKLQLHGGGVSRRSFIHIDDVSSATWALMKDGTNGQTYHISTGEIVTIRELVERICDKVGVAFDDAVEVAGDRLGKDDAYLLDSSKLRRELGWRDAITLDEGLDACADWVEGNLETLKAMPGDYIHKA